MTSSAHAAWLHLCPAAQAQAEGTGLPQALVLRPDGSQARFLVNNQPSLPGCRSTALPAELQHIEAVHPLPPDAVPGDILLLQGANKEGRFTLGSVTLPGKAAPQAPAVMPMHVNLLATMSARAFGVEERTRVHLADGRLNVECSAGAKPAGVLLSGPWVLPRADAVLEVSYSGTGAFEWQAADAALSAAESGTGMGRIAARGVGQAVRLPFPRELDRASWKQFALVCPAQAASLQVEAVRLVPAARKPAPRSTWVWRAEEWQRQPDRLLDWAQHQGIAELFIAVEVEHGAVRDPAALAAFVHAASSRRIAVWSVDGDPRMVVPAEQAAAVQRARAYAAYNARVDAAARLRGMQFDIEPYLLPGYDGAAAEWDRRYAQLAAALRKAAGKLPLEFVVPYWWSDKPALLRALAASADGVTVMDYRTDPQEIYRFGAPFLDWGVANGKRVRIALEAGPVAPETQRRYVRAGRGGAGELLLVKLDGGSALVLLKAPQAAGNANVYRLAGSREFDGSATSFHAGRARLEVLLPGLENDFSAWPSFGGIALHEFR